MLINGCVFLLSIKLPAHICIQFYLFSKLEYGISRYYIDNQKDQKYIL